MSRIGAFVAAARRLLWMQVGAAVIAVALAIWALVAVRDLAAERDRLAAEVLQLQRAGPQPAVPGATATGPAPSPLDSEMRPPAIMPIFVPIIGDAAITPPIPPVEIPPAVEPGTAAPSPPVQAPAAPADCSGPNAELQRCRPGRWRRTPPVATQPVAPVETPQRTPETPPRN